MKDGLNILANGTKHWWLNDKQHRADGPAVEGLSDLPMTLKTIKLGLNNSGDYMKFSLLAGLFLLSSLANAGFHFEGHPHTIIQINSDGSVEREMIGLKGVAEVRKHLCIIDVVDDDIYWTSRNNVKLGYAKSGIFGTFYDLNGAAFVKFGDGKYTEVVTIGTSMIIYVGYCFAKNE
jgi:hypothetical protein